MTLSKAQKRARARKNQNQVRGKGDFHIPSLVKKIASQVKNQVVNNKDLVRSVAIKAGGYAGQRMGSKRAGQAAARGLLKVSGMGDYDLHANSLISSSGNLVPTFSPDGRRGIRIREREMIGEIKSGTLSGGSTVFTNQSFVINPSNAQTFPWLSGFAGLFEQWEPNGIIFEYRSTSSDFNGTAQSLGVVVTATEYNSADANYDSKIEMENSAYAKSAKASEGIFHGVECDPNERPTKVFYTGVGSVAGTPDNLHNLGRFQIATQGMSVAGVTLGELYVTYDITFYKKQITTDALVFSEYTAANMSLVNGARFMQGLVGAVNTGSLPWVFTGTDGKFRWDDNAIGRYRITVAFETAATIAAFNWLGIDGATVLGVANLEQQTVTYTPNIGTFPDVVWFCDVVLSKASTEHSFKFAPFGGTSVAATDIKVTCTRVDKDNTGIVYE